MENKHARQKLNIVEYADRILLLAVTVLFCFFLLFIYRTDKEEIAKLADETIEFLETVCQRYDGYAEGQKAAVLKDVQDKARGLSELVGLEKSTDDDYLMQFAKVQNLTGILVTDGNLNLVAQADVEGMDSYRLWNEFLHERNKKDILTYRKKIYSGTVNLDEKLYDVVVLARENAEGLILCYSKTEAPVTDIYEATLEKTLTNNTFHKNPKIVISDGEAVIAANTSLGSDENGELLKDDDESCWKSGRLVELKTNGTIWYGKRQVYEKYYIYVFYPASEVFDNMLSIIAIGVALCAILCLIMTLIRHNSEKQYIEEERKQLDTIKAISSLYVTTSILHLRENRVEGIMSTDRAQQILDETTEAGQVAKELAERIIAAEYRKKYVTFLDFSTMENRMEHNENLTEVFKDINGIWFSAFLVPISFDKEGKVTDVLFACRNINDYMQKEEAYQEQLKRTARDAKIANAAKTSFLRRMSHDVRTPVNGIRGMAVLAEKSPGLPKQAKEYIEKIITSSDYLQDLLEDILRMNKLESGTMEFEEKPFDLRKVLADTAEFIEARAKEKGISFRIDMEEIQHAHVIGSPLHLRQVMQNILPNAVKFNNPGGSISVVCREISSTKESMTIEIVCADTGNGISPEFQAHVFEPFSQEAETARTNYAGNGLGLAVTKEIVEQRDGTITFTSEKGKGSTFIVTLPFLLDLSVANEEDHLKEQTIAGIRILLVEDNELNMEIAHCILEEKGALITEAQNGKEAVEIFEKSAPGSFDIILMDIMMPEMDGMEAAKTIRKMKREDALTIPIFAMTANAFIDDISQSRAAGMNEHLTKPLNMDDVVALIYQYCR